MNVKAAPRIPLWLKIVDSVYVCALFTLYGFTYGPTNFLWFSDIAMLGIAVAWWLENSLLASTMAVLVLLPELVWNISFFTHLIFGVDVGGITSYMFESQRPFYLRAASLFHAALPILLLWTPYRLGYDRRAWKVATPLGWVVLAVSYCVSSPADNLNWVFRLGAHPLPLSPPLYLILLMVLLPLLLYLPTHWMLAKLFRSA